MQEKSHRLDRLARQIGLKVLPEYNYIYPRVVEAVYWGLKQWYANLPSISHPNQYNRQRPDHNTGSFVPYALR